jgi:hypothetical protein
VKDADASVVEGGAANGGKQPVTFVGQYGHDPNEQHASPTEPPAQKPSTVGQSAVKFDIELSNE